ncbi:MAG: hypothetical protein EZS28_017956 [Streblomastix strix]|uniref:Uncharacterized protein n=1 Tax=Streblomastix strix TaxID=222440 RepID=A0A5J4VVN3_9EUKA|nr:MAG: hypothetical protein EZS28_017956 [Streblomastix strix]
MMQFSSRKRRGEVSENPATSLQRDEKVYVRPKPLAKAVDFSWVGQTEVKPEVLRVIIDAAHRKHEKFHLPEPIDPDAPIPGRISPTRREHEKVHECGQINVQIQDSIQLVEDKTKQNALEKERLLVRDFKDKLSIAEKTIEELKKRSPEFDANYWMKKYMEVQREVDVISSEAVRLDSLNQEVADEMNSVRSELHSSQAECEGLTKRLVGVQYQLINYIN